MRVIGRAALAVTSLLLMSPSEALSAATAPAAQAQAPRANAPTPTSEPEAKSPAVGAATPAATGAESGDAKPAEAPKPLPPTLIAKVNLTNQTMSVVINGKPVHSWKVSSGAPGYGTPVGTFKPDWMAKMWYSKQYDDAPMPHSVFFKNGAAIHATQSVGRLGTAASHGCVRLSPANAETFYKLVTRHGLAMTRIAVSGHAAGRDERHEDRISRRDGQGHQDPRAAYTSLAQRAVQSPRAKPAYQPWTIASSSPRSSAPTLTFPGDRATGYVRPMGATSVNRTPYWAR